MRLKGKRVLVTGAARGIGESIAELFAAEGAMVIVSDIQDELGQKVAAKLGECARYIHLDVSKEADWIEASRQISAEYGGLDVLVNNAGIAGILETSGPHDPENLDIDSWHAVHQVNLDGCQSRPVKPLVFYCPHYPTKFLLPLFRASRW